MNIGAFALTAAALFTGASFYITWVEQPARLSLEDKPLLAEFKTSYDVAYTILAPLVVIGTVLGVLAAFTNSNGWWMLGAILLGANYAATMYLVDPVDKDLKAATPETAGPQARELIKKWGQVHAIRTGLGAAATLLFLLAS
jgi:hypothetical protein